MKAVTLSCHVERPLDDQRLGSFSELQALRPHGFRTAALMRPPDPDENETLWLARARIAAARGPFGHHTHWGGATQARPVDGDPAERVRREAAWLRDRGLEPRFFCGGGWYMDESVATTLVELGYTDCTEHRVPARLPARRRGQASARRARLAQDRRREAARAARDALGRDGRARVARAAACRASCTSTSTTPICSTAAAAARCSPLWQ